MDILDLLIGIFPISLLLGAVVSGLTELAKEWDWNPKVTVFFLSLFVALIVQMFLEFVPVVTQAAFLEFFAMVMGTAVVIYDFLLKTPKSDVPVDVGPIGSDN